MPSKGEQAPWTGNRWKLACPESILYNIHNMKKLLFTLLLILLFSTVGFFIWHKNYQGDKKEEVVIFPDLENKMVETQEIKKLLDELENKDDDIIIEKEKNSLPEENKQKLPEEILIEVPFASQAPFAVWDDYHEEACEETALIMAYYYLQGKELNAQITEREIQDLISFQIKKYGDYRDSNAAEIVKLAEDFYGMENLKIIYDFKKDRIKEELAQENPIIVPAAGRLLGNPFFTPPGPLYHNLVLIGYEGDEIITNDPGTKRGENYRYDLDILYQAIHDFPGDKNLIEQGRKAMIVIKK